MLLLSPPAPGTGCAPPPPSSPGELASRVRAAAAGEATTPEAMRAAKERLRAAFTAAPYRPTGLATADQALGSLVQLLEWGATQVGDAFDGHIDLTQGCPQDRALLLRSADLFADTQALLTGQAADPDFAALESARAASAEHLRELSGRAGEPDARIAAAQAVHAQAISVVARSVAADALIVSHRASEETIEAERRHWYGRPGPSPAVGARPGPHAALARTPGAASVTDRGDAGAAARVGPLGLVPQLAAGGDGARGGRRRRRRVRGAARVLGRARHAVGAAHQRRGDRVDGVAGAGGHRRRVRDRRGAAHRDRDQSRALWAVFPVAVAIAAYAPGTTPFLVGQAAFTVTIVVLFNLLAPVGWTVGLLRVEDVAIGCARQLRGRRAAVAARRGGGGRRRPRRRVPVRRGVPDPGGRTGR